MATLIRNTCGQCGRLVVNDERKKAYVHAPIGIKLDHEVTQVIATKLTDKL